MNTALSQGRGSLPRRFEMEQQYRCDRLRRNPAVHARSSRYLLCLRQEYLGRDADFPPARGRQGANYSGSLVTLHMRARGAPPRPGLVLSRESNDPVAATPDPRFGASRPGRTLASMHPEGGRRAPAMRRTEAPRSDQTPGRSPRLTYPRTDDNRPRYPLPQRLPLGRQHRSERIQQ